MPAKLRGIAFAVFVSATAAQAETLQKIKETASVTMEVREAGFLHRQHCGARCFVGVLRRAGHC